MTPGYTCLLETDGRPLEVDFCAIDDNSARVEAVLSAAEALKDSAIRGQVVTQLRVKAFNPLGVMILETHIQIMRRSSGGVAFPQLTPASGPTPVG